jgi:hypothetical protein
MPITQSSNRAIRYQNRCSKKKIEEQSVQRTERYEKRCAMQEEAKQSVSEEFKNKKQVKRISQRRTSEGKTMAYGFFGKYF